MVIFINQIGPLSAEIERSGTPIGRTSPAISRGSEQPEHPADEIEHRLLDGDVSFDDARLPALFRGRCRDDRMHVVRFERPHAMDTTRCRHSDRIGVSF